MRGKEQERKGRGRGKGEFFNYSNNLSRAD